jgi:hypothetical protein
MKITITILVKWITEVIELKEFFLQIDEIPRLLEVNFMQDQDAEK